MTSSRSNIVCSSCLAGASLTSGGSCVSNCPLGQFASGGSNSACFQCNDNCAACSSANICTSCLSSSLLVNSTCIQTTSCKTGSFLTNGRCQACSGDCASCSGAFNSCTSCPSFRPVLTSSNTCEVACPLGQFTDALTSTCQACSSSCRSCFGSAFSQCLSCAANSVLSEGSCLVANCTAGLSPVSNFGVCLENLVRIAPDPRSSSSSSTNAGSILVPLLSTLAGIMLLSILSLFALRWYCKKKRKTKTERFEKKKDIGVFSLRQRLKQRFGFGKRDSWGNATGSTDSIVLNDRDRLIRSISAPVIQNETAFSTPIPTIITHHTGVSLLLSNEVADVLSSLPTYLITHSI